MRHVKSPDIGQGNFIEYHTLPLSTGSFAGCALRFIGYITIGNQYTTMQI
ncbi:hypothetical protein XSR1_310039 [Xenorhabdus szentirmaii DSM 16338]|uniref:Uncharacterized protein n=1 Tax=Xenorhabdus szentirmaii DSM 16338 TaxID=1427518 RepID=W1J0W2_9GAMM|nr:hypothetical protein XSR1_310039 [Xenorhabdus szentirmaii DSM 16338]